MKRLLNTLYVTRDGSFLSKEGETVVVKHEGEKVMRVPVRTLGSIVCYGNVSASPHLFRLCSEHGVTISFMSGYGKFIARVEGPVSGNVLLRREQYRRADNDRESAVIARAAVVGKLANCRTVLRRFLRDYPDSDACQPVHEAVTSISASIDASEGTSDVEFIRGIEGDGTKRYFDVFDHLILADKEAFYFHSRNRRPPLDRVNCLLSFLYSLMTHDVRSACESVGLDPQAGFLHRFRAGRPSLALDLMEEFRPFIADRLVLSLINKRQIRAKGFTCGPTGAFTMDEATRKTVLVTYQQRKQEEVIHPFIGEKMSIGILFHMQALLLSRFLRGDLDGYPPFIWR